MEPSWLFSLIVVWLSRYRCN